MAKYKRSLVFDSWECRMIRCFLVVVLILALLACDVVAEPTRWPTSTPPLIEDASSDLPSAEKKESLVVEQPSVATPMISNTGLTLDAETVVTESGLQIKDLIAGKGDRAREGSIVVVHYTGSLLDGTKFDSSVDRGIPFEFTLGQKSVIKGWDEGVASMRIGGKRQLVIPSDLAYGDRGVGPIIKPGDTLVFEIELLDVKGP